MSVQMPVLRLVARLRLIALFGLAAFLAASGRAGAADHVYARCTIFRAAPTALTP